MNAADLAPDDAGGRLLTLAKARGQPRPTCDAGRRWRACSRQVESEGARAVRGPPHAALERAGARTKLAGKTTAKGPAPFGQPREQTPCVHAVRRPHHGQPGRISRTATPRSRVRDTGPGSARENIGRLNERFIASKAAAARRYRGHGLGLSIVDVVATATAASSKSRASRSRIHVSASSCRPRCVRPWRRGKRGMKRRKRREEKKRRNKGRTRQKRGGGRVEKRRKERETGNRMSRHG